MLRFFLCRSRTARLIGHQLPDRFRKFWEFIEDTDGAQPLFMVERRRAAHHRPSRDIAVSAALRGHDDAVADLAVPGDANLSGQDHVLAHCGRSRKAHLRAQQRMLAHRRAVPHLHQVVDFSAAPDAGFANAGAVDT